MDVRRMSLIDTPIDQIEAVTMNAYKLGADKANFITEKLLKFEDSEYWNPEFQAWKPMLETYLSSGVNPQLTKRFYGDLLDKTGSLEPPPSCLSDLFGDILRYRNTTNSEVFRSVPYSQIESFCDEQCTFFVSSRKTIVAQLYTPVMYIETLKEMTSVESWKGMMCALSLFRHCQIEGFKWPVSVVGPLQERLAEWLEIFLQSFDEVTEFVKNLSSVYAWYCPKVREVLMRTWKTSLILRDRPDVLHSGDVYSLPVDISQKLVSVVNTCPAVYDNPMSEQTVWNAIYPVFFDDNPDDPMFWERSYMSLCVPKSYLKRMSDILYEFYWEVKDGKLTGRLYAKKDVEYHNGINTDTTPEEYLQQLIMRGFPMVKD